MPAGTSFSNSGGIPVHLRVLAVTGGIGVVHLGRWEQPQAKSPTRTMQTSSTGRAISPEKQKRARPRRRTRPGTGAARRPAARRRSWRRPGRRPGRGPRRAAHASSPPWAAGCADSCCGRRRGTPSGRSGASAGMGARAEGAEAQPHRRPRPPIARGNAGGIGRRGAEHGAELAGAQSGEGVARVRAAGARCPRGRTGKKSSRNTASSAWGMRLSLTGALQPGGGAEPADIPPEERH